MALITHNNLTNLLNKRSQTQQYILFYLYHLAKTYSSMLLEIRMLFCFEEGCGWVVTRREPTGDLRDTGNVILNMGGGCAGVVTW